MSVKFKWSSAAFNQIRTDPALKGHIDDLAEGIAGRAGRGFDWKSSVRQGRNGRRHRAIVFSKGRIVGEIDRSELSGQMLSSLASGARAN